MFKKFNNWVKSQEKILSQRDYQLIKKSGKIILGNVCEGQEFPWYPYRCIKPFKFPAGTQEWSNGLWNWDSAFHAMGVRRWDIQLAKEQILGFTQYQLKDGMFVDSVRKDGEIIAFSSKPPVFAYAVQKIYEQDGDIEFIKAVYPRLAKNQEFWDDLRSWKGLFHYGANLSNTNTDHFIQSIKNESGWDNSVRWDVSCSDFWAIDLNCFMIMRFRSMSFLANALGKKDDAENFAKCAEELSQKINKYFWNDELRAYTDINRFNLKPSDVLTPASFMPLFVGVATPERAEYMEKLAADERKFFPGMPTVSYDNPNFSLEKYWRGNTWLNVAYFAAKGLKNYGYHETADAIKETILGWVEKDGDCIHENYNSVTGDGLFCSKFSWSSVFVIEFILNW